MSNELATNLQRLQPSGKKPQPGDVFVMLLPNGRYLFGRVISITADAGFGPPTSILVYIYKAQSELKQVPDRSELRPNRLLISPAMINRLGWSRGYFETIGNIPLDDADVLRQHCFFSSVTSEYRDENGNQIMRPAEPVGQLGLGNYRTLDDDISTALGIPLAPG